MFDEVELILGSVVPDVDQRLHPSPTVHIAARAVGGVEHLGFLTTTLDVPARVLPVERVGHVARP